tara:strand:- start:2623 stop:3513 length:891 start_codon:yes stop_codon:yes gene_type:complete
MSYKQFNILWSNNCKKTEYKSISISDKYVIISGKNSYKIKIFSKESGNYIKTLKNKKNFFTSEDPQDEIAINNLLFVTDKEKSVCSIFNIDMDSPLAIFGFKNLSNPSGINGYYDEDNDTYLIYILDKGQNNIVKFKLQISDNQINNLESELFVKLMYPNIDKIQIDFELKQILGCCNKDNKLIIFDYNGNKINEMEGEVENMAIYNNYYIFTDKSIDSNMLHLYERKSLKYLQSFYSSQIRFINDVVANNRELYIIDNKCSLSKIDLGLDLSSDENFLNKFLLIGTLGYIFYKML